MTTGARDDCSAFGVMKEHLEGFKGTEGLLFIGKAQEKSRVFRTEGRRHPKTGQRFAWMVSSTALVNHGEHMPMKSTERYLVVYSSFVTLAFAASVYILLRPHSLLKVDRIQAHRIDLIEPDGTERLILSDRTNYPGSFFHGREVQRSDRKDSAGMLFIDDEGNEDGGLIFGGKLVNGHAVTFGHLSFDAYQQDQTISLESTFEDGQRRSAVALNDMPDSPLTPAMMEDVERVKAMPDGPAQDAAWQAVTAKYEFGHNRALLARKPDGSVGLTLNDVQGHPRMKLIVLPSGEPEIDMLDSQGKTLRTISGK